MALSDKLLRKTKLLYLKEILERNTDADHDMTQAQIQAMLDKKHMSPKTRTLHDDLESLQECLPDFGMELTNNVKPGKDKAHTLRYKITKRLFTPTEVKLLMECVRGLHSLNSDQAEELIKKLSQLCSDAEAQDIKKHLAVVGGFKPIVRKRSKRYSTFRAIEAIDKSIDQNRKLRFRYFWYTVSQLKDYWRKNSHTVSPLVRVLEAGNYYLIAIDEEGKLHHYRLDRMIDAEVIDEKRRPSPLIDYSQTEWKDYVNSSFGMGLTDPVPRSGHHVQPVANNRLITVSIKFTRDLVGVVMDRFGNEILLTKVDNGHFIATFHAYQNVQFLTWLIGLGKKVQVISPQAFRKDLSRFARQAGCWHHYNKYVVLGEYMAWKHRKPYWAKEEEDSSGDESWGDGIWK